MVLELALEPVEVPLHLQQAKAQNHRQQSWSAGDGFDYLVETACEYRRAGQSHLVPVLLRQVLSNRNEAIQQAQLGDC